METAVFQAFQTSDHGGRRPHAGRRQGGTNVGHADRLILSKWLVNWFQSRAGETAEDAFCETLVNTTTLIVFSTQNGRRWGELRRGERSASARVAHAIISAAYRLNYFDRTKQFEPSDRVNYLTSQCLWFVSNDRELKAIQRELQQVRSENNRLGHLKNQFFETLAKPGADVEALGRLWKRKISQFRFGTVAVDFDSSFGEEPDYADCPECEPNEPDTPEVKLRSLTIDIDASQYSHRWYATVDQQLRYREAMAFAASDSPVKRIEDAGRAVYNRSLTQRLVRESDGDERAMMEMESLLESWHKIGTVKSQGG